MSRSEKKLYFSIDGGDYIDLKISPEIFITFGIPAMTADTFFNSANVVNNIALLLGVPANMIRRVNIVRENSINRVKRQAGSSSSLHYLEIVIGNDPVTSVSDVVTYKEKVVEINQLAAQIVNLVHVGELQQKAQALFNLTIETAEYEQTPNENMNYSAKEIRKVKEIKVTQQFSGCRAQSKCDIQAIVQVVDENVS